MGSEMCIRDRDWVDESMIAHDANGKEFYAYGGDLGGADLYNDGNFCANGLVNAKRIPQPAIIEVKKVYQDISFKLNGNALTVKNLYKFVDLSGFNFKWELLKDGKKVQDGTFNLKTAAGESANVPLNLKTDNSGEYYLSVYAYTTTATPLVPKGHELAREQFKVGGDYFASAKANATGKLTVKQKKNVLTFEANGITGAFDVKTGTFTSYKRKDAADETLTAFPTPYFWRAPTDNDFGNNGQKKLAVWRFAHKNPTVQAVTVGKKTDAGQPIEVKYLLKDVNVPYTINYLIQPDGNITVTASMDRTGKNTPELPRFGMRAELPGSYENLNYYGRGPQENYSDRNTAAFVGTYNDKVANQFTWTYIRPQEVGYKTDARWISLTDANGKGIVVTGSQPLSFSTLNVPTESLDPGTEKKQVHTQLDVHPEDKVYFQIDLAQRGLGGDNSWGALPHDPYRLLADTYTYTYTISLK